MQINSLHFFAARLGARLGEWRAAGGEACANQTTMMFGEEKWRSCTSVAASLPTGVERATRARWAGLHLRGPSVIIRQGPACLTELAPIWNLLSALTLVFKFIPEISHLR